MYLGVDYYPEQWDRCLIDQDLDNIVELNCNIIRIADFAWSIIEPQDGVYDFSIFDEVIEKAKKRGLKVMMCIPTATMPRWLHKKYPDIMQVDQLGNSQPYGGRRGYCYNNENYIKKSLALTKAIANHYKDNETIVAWQLDNEVGHEGSDMCYCDSCHNHFIEFLKNKYSNIDDLNKRWGTSFWSQVYDDFEDIELPKKAYTAQNPSLRMEWERFRSLSIEDYLKMEYTALKEIINNALILHDFEGGTLEKHFDPYAISKNLDDIAYNNYPVWGGKEEPMEPWEVALSLDAARGFKQKNFWITEEIMGAQGHDIIGCAIKPKQGSCWALQSMAHGCKSFLVFRYRGYTKGAEQFCYGILDADNQKRRKFYEVKELFKFLKENEKVFENEIETKAAIVFDYDSASCFKIQQQSTNFNYLNEIAKLHKQFYKRDMLVDVIDSTAPIEKYDILIVPNQIIVNDETKNKYKEFVRNGKTIVFTNKLSWKDEDNNLVLNQRLPVGLTNLIGGLIEEQESLLGKQYCEVISEDGVVYYGEVFAEMMKATTARVMMKYHNNCFGEYGAVLENKYGHGTAYYLATSLEEKALDTIFDEILKNKIKENLYVESIKRGEYLITIDYKNLEFKIEKKLI